MHVICRFQLHVVAAPASAVFYSFFSLSECTANGSHWLRGCHVLHVSVTLGIKCTHIRKGKMWNVLSSRISSSGSSPAPASSQGGVFPISMPILSISVCQGIQVGVYPLHTRCTFLISFSLSQLLTLDLVLSFSQVSFLGYLSLSPPPFSPLSGTFSVFCTILRHPTISWLCVFFLISQFDLSVFPRSQLYGEYREQLGNFARREAARLLTERQWRRQAGDNTTATNRKGLGRWHHHHHSVTLESHASHTSSSKKPRPYSKCQGDQRERGQLAVYSQTFRRLQIMKL